MSGFTCRFDHGVHRAVLLGQRPNASATGLGGQPLQGLHGRVGQLDALAFQPGP